MYCPPKVGSFGPTLGGQYKIGIFKLTFIEFADLTSCLEHTATEVYYAHPFSSWEREANEQNNGMIRRFIPKGIDSQSVTPEMVQRVESWLIHYPRKVHGYAPSFDVFY